MSSLKNSLHRREHKERSQPSHRTRLGLLEKHKDYVLRARDYHSKQDRIKKLQQKAADRNKDEFYFSMSRQRTQAGVHIQDRGNASLPVDFVKILKTQDENYIRNMRTAGLKKIEKLKAQLTELADLIAPHIAGYRKRDEGGEGLDDQELEVLRQAGIIKDSKSSKRTSKQTSKHLIFVENETEAQRYTIGLPLLSRLESVGEERKAEAEDSLDLGWKEESKSKGKRKANRMEVDVEGGSFEASERWEAAKKHRTRLLKELSARLTRDTLLRYAERELEMQRALMGKGGSLKLRGVEKVGGDDDDDELNEDELDSMKIKKAERLARKEEKAYKPRIYRWRLERKK